MNTLADACAESPELRFDHFRQSHQHDASVTGLVDKRGRSGHRHVRAVIATHAIYGYGNQRGLGRFNPLAAHGTSMRYAFFSPQDSRMRTMTGSAIMPLCCAVWQPKAGGLLFALGLHD